MNRSRISSFPSKFLYMAAMLIAVLFVVVGCTSETPELVATAEPTVSPTTQPEATAEPTDSSTEEPGPTAKPLPAAEPTPEPTATPLPAQISQPTATPSSTATPDPTATPIPAPTPTPEPTSPPMPETFNIGDTVRLGNLEITVNGIMGSLGKDIWSPETGNYFLYIDATIVNRGDEAEIVSSLFQMELRDDEGRSYDVDFTAISANDAGQLDGEIFAGGVLRGQVGYQLPAKPENLNWHFIGDIFRPGQAVFALGLVEPPTPPPGSTIDDPINAGEVLTGSDGLQIRVLEVVGDARQQVAEENEFNDPPAEGYRFFMLRLEVSNPAGAESVDASYFDYSLIGDNRVVYTTFENSCGIIPDELNAELFAGGRAEGNICFQIPVAERELILIHEPGFGFGSRRFLNIEE